MRIAIFTALTGGGCTSAFQTYGPESTRPATGPVSRLARRRAGMAGLANELVELLHQFGREGFIGAAGCIGLPQPPGQPRHYLRLLGIAAAQHAHA
jgi:hypothetical protein